MEKPAMYLSCFTHRTELTLLMRIEGYPLDFKKFLGILGRSELKIAVLYYFLKVDWVINSFYYLSSVFLGAMSMNSNLQYKIIAIKSVLEKFLFSYVWVFLNQLLQWEKNLSQCSLWFQFPCCVEMCQFFFPQYLLKYLNCRPIKENTPDYLW